MGGDRAYPEHIERCREAGMNGYVAKPYTEQILTAEMERVMARSIDPALL